ncbi:MAG: DNA-3-methyladenine glycosylase [Verrucomicrobiota bacterium]
MTSEACEYLSNRCEVMRRLIREHGPCMLVLNGRRTPFESLVRAVAHQQLHASAAESILARFVALFGTGRFPTPQRFATVSDDAVRACGFSRAKTAALRDIAEKTLSGVVPGPRAIGKMSDEEIIERLIQVRGVGRWTVEMLLISTLGRPDVLPVDDFGVRNGIRIAFGLKEMPRPRELAAYAQPWRPYATTAVWYLWRAADQSGKKKAAMAEA